MRAARRAGILHANKATPQENNSGEGQRIGGTHLIQQLADNQSKPSVTEIPANRQIRCWEGC